MVSRAVPRMVKITINTLLAGGFAAYLLVLILLYPARFSDRDLLMCYHWGLGVGHVHVHQSASTSGCDSNLAEDAQDIDMELPEVRDSPAQANDGGSDMVMSQTTQSCV